MEWKKVIQKRLPFPDMERMWKHTIMTKVGNGQRVEESESMREVIGIHRKK